MSIDFAAAARKPAARVTKKKPQTKTGEEAVAAVETETEAEESETTCWGGAGRGGDTDATTAEGAPLPLAKLPRQWTPVPSSPAFASSASAAAPPTTADDFDLGRMKQSLLFGFADTASKFLEHTVLVWPKDLILSRWHDTLDATAAAADDKGREVFYTMIINTFHEGFKRHYTQINKRDEAMLSDESNKWLKMLRAKTKYRASAPVLRAQLWEFLEQLASMSNLWSLYARCPPKLFERIKGVLGGFAARIQRGEANVRDIDPMAIARELTTSMNKDEMRAFAESVMNEGGVEGITALISSLSPLLSKSGFDMTGLTRRLQETMRSFGFGGA